ncbi:MAG TPA: copper chaperone PCu(A)C [Casimicrobiaceae bacterium]|nr:copper chaperone PCu(A)C [Casimicrobiaceae bacterium]
MTRRWTPYCGGARFACGLALALIAIDTPAMFVVNQPWVAPATRGRSTEAYMDLTSTDGVLLVEARSDAAVSVAIRAPGKSRSDVAKLPLPTGKMVRLAPGGYRLLLNGLRRSISLGDRVMLTLTIQAADGSRQEISVDAEARLQSPLDEDRPGHEHKQ